MTAATHLSDRMPDVARGAASWRSEDLAHLSACDECRVEWDVVRLGAAIGVDVVAGLDLDRIATRIMSDPARREPALRARPVLLRRASWLAVTAAAAALVMAVLRSSPGPVVEPTVTAIMLPELERLSADELESVLEILPAGDGWPVPGTGLGDLTDDELERVIGTLEG